MAVCRHRGTSCLRKKQSGHSSPETLTSQDCLSSHWSLATVVWCTEVVSTANQCPAPEALSALPCSHVLEVGSNCSCCEPRASTSKTARYQEVSMDLVWKNLWHDKASSILWSQHQVEPDLWVLD